MYVTYSYYKEQYVGSLPEEEFIKAERWSEAYIRNLTYIHGDIFASDLDMLRDAVCAGAEVYASYRRKQESNNGMQIKSESTDGYSVTYVNEQTDGQTLEELMQKKAYEAVKMYLLPTGWLSRKVRCCDDNKQCCNSL